MTPSTNSPKSNTKQMALIGLTTAIICILAPFSIVLPFSPVPISLGTLAIYFIVSIFEIKQSLISVVLYILLGLAGLPVFSGFTGGAAVLFGPTGGYIIGYLFLVLISSIIICKGKHKPLFCFIGLFTGTLVCYLFGTIWLAFQGNLSTAEAFLVAVLPFLPGDVAKVFVALPLADQLRKRLLKAGLL